MSRKNRENRRAKIQRRDRKRDRKITTPAATSSRPQSRRPSGPTTREPSLLSRVFFGLGRRARRVLPSAVVALVGSLILTMTVMAGGASASSKKDTSVKSKTGTSQRADFLAQEKAATEALIAEMTGKASATEKKEPAAPKAEVKEVKADVSAPAQPQAAPQTEAKVSPDQMSILDAFVAAEIASLRAKEAKQPVAQKMESSHPSAKITPVDHGPLNGVTIGVEQDRNYSPGNSDNEGDGKILSSGYSCKDPENDRVWKLGIETGLLTPQINKQGQQFDTRYFVANFGLSTMPSAKREYGGFVYAGMANAGGLSDTMRNISKYMHSSKGMGMRESPLSSGPRFIVGVSGYADWNLYKKQLVGNHAFLLRGGVDGRLGTDEVGMGLTGTAVFTNAQGQLFSSSGTPYLRAGEYAIYGQVHAGVRAYHLPTANAGTNPLDMSWKVAGDLGLTDNVSFGAFFKQKFTTDVMEAGPKPSSKPVGVFGGHLTFTF